MECQHLASRDLRSAGGGCEASARRPCQPLTTAERKDSPDCGAELDGRKAAILNAVVTEYIGSAQPVGSQHVVDAPGVNVSSATVRSDMATLEREGYLTQPHTSAGRIPTDKGYRFFVDHLAGPGPSTPSAASRSASSSTMPTGRSSRCSNGRRGCWPT